MRQWRWHLHMEFWKLEAPMRDRCPPALTRVSFYFLFFLMIFSCSMLCLALLCLSSESMCCVSPCPRVFVRRVLPSALFLFFPVFVAFPSLCLASLAFPPSTFVPIDATCRSLALDCMMIGLVLPEPGQLRRGRQVPDHDVTYMHAPAYPALCIRLTTDIHMIGPLCERLSALAPAGCRISRRFASCSVFQDAFLYVAHNESPLFQENETFASNSRRKTETVCSMCDL